MTLTISDAFAVTVSSPIGDAVPGHGAGQRRRDRLAEVLEGFAHAPQRSIVPVRRIFFCSSSTP